MLIWAKVSHWSVNKQGALIATAKPESEELFRITGHVLLDRAALYATGYDPDMNLAVGDRIQLAISARANRIFNIERRQQRGVANPGHSFLLLEGDKKMKEIREQFLKKIADENADYFQAILEAINDLQKTLGLCLHSASTEVTHWAAETGIIPDLLEGETEEEDKTDGGQQAPT